MTITPRQATIAALTTIALMGAGSALARADTLLTATATVRADTSVSFLSGWSCTSPYRTCSYRWRWLDGSRLGVTLANGSDRRSYLAAPGTFPAGCHTVEHRVSYFVGRERLARTQVMYVGFCVAGVVG